MRFPNNEASQFSKFHFPWNKEAKLASNSFFREHNLYFKKTLNSFKVIYHLVSCLLDLHTHTCLGSDSLTEFMVKDLCNIFSDWCCKVTKFIIFSKSYQRQQKKVFIQKACFTLKSNQTELGEFWKPVTLSQIDYFCSFLSATQYQVLRSI